MSALELSFTSLSSTPECTSVLEKSRMSLPLEVKLEYKTNNKVGYLEIILGPMFSSKTTTILEIYKKCVFCNIPVAVINHSSDIRYHDEMLSSHDFVMAPCLQAVRLDDVMSSKEVMYADVVLINEGQFFEDLYEVVLIMLRHKKKVYVCGLDGDFERKKFGQILDIIPYCDKVTKLTSLCSICKDGTPGIFSMRLTEEQSQTVIGSSNYIPVCRNCYDK
jgi:thymidine kinase